MLCLQAGGNVPGQPARIHGTPKLVDLCGILPHDPNATRSTVLRIRAAYLSLSDVNVTVQCHCPRGSCVGAGVWPGRRTRAVNN